MRQPTLKKGEIKRVKKVAPTSEDFKNEDSLLDSIESDLEANGIKMFDNDNIDNDYLILPPHLDEEEPRNISRFLHAFTQQRIWTRTLLARVGILLREAEDSLDKEKARVFNSLPVKLSVKEKELALFSDEDCVPMLERLKSIEAKKEMLELYMKNLEDAIFDISREISRRGYDMSSQTRVENVDSVRRHNYR